MQLPASAGSQGAKRQLLQRIVESPGFKHAQSLTKILQYLCQRAASGDHVPAKEFDIAVDVLGRPETFDPKIDPIVRVSVAAIRQRLRAYFESAGANEVLRVDIPKGLYRAVFSPNSSAGVSRAEFDAQRPMLNRFWQPYLTGQFENLLVYADVLFFRDDRGSYLRNIYVNTMPDGVQEVRNRLRIDPSTPLKPSFHFLSAGEVHAMISLIHLFAQLRAPLAVRSARFTSWTELRHSNLILLGSSRTNPFVDSLQGGNDFVITADEIRNVHPRANEQSAYTGQRYLEGKLENAIEPLVVTRRSGLTPGTAVTIVSANHGRAIEGAGNLLTAESDLAGVLASAGLDHDPFIPNYFQLLLQVRMVDFDEEVLNVDYVSKRV